MADPRAHADPLALSGNTPLNNVIRLFISSTFADFQVERTVLQWRVFPRLRALCREAGVRFQPLDLRWGVSQEASLAQQTLQICVEEIQRCQRISPDLNFVLFLGDRYGSRLLPETIPAEEYSTLASAMERRERTLLKSWYALDRNAIPPTYVLLPRPIADKRWREQVARPLLAALAAGAATLDEDVALLYTASVTHLEIAHGLLRLPDTRHVVCALRTFTPSPEPRAAGVYADTDAHTREQLKALKSTLHARLGDKVGEYQVSWRTGGLPWRAGGPAFEYDTLEQELYTLFEGPVRAAIARRQEASTTLQPILAANARFADERTAHFTGRTEPLRAVVAYVADITAPAPVPPLVVTGPAGAGKSTLLAQALKEATMAYPGAVPVSRYAGITPETTSLRDLLAGLRREIWDTYAVSAEERDRLPSDEIGLVTTFPVVLKMVTHEQPLLLVIDALDQLGTAPLSLDWLPAMLPPHVRIVVSILPDRPEYAQLAERLPSTQLVILQPMEPHEGEELLDRWLADAGRTLQAEQRAAVVDAFAPEGNPLHLRLLMDDARRWRSFTPPTPQPATIPAVLTRLFDELALRHGPHLVGRALGFIGAGREGIAEDEALDLLARDAPVRMEQRQRAPNSPPIDPTLPLPDMLWVRFYAEVAPYLTERQGSGAQVITFYHQALRAAVAEHYLIDEDRTARHRALATYFAEQPLISGEQPNRRKLAELAYQQAQGSMEAALKATVTDARFLEQRIAASGTVSALEDLAYLREDTTSKTLSATLRLSAHVLDHDATQLVGQITGRMGASSPLHDTEASGPMLRLVSATLTPTGGPLIRILSGHTEQVEACAFSPDGRMIATGSRDNTARLWDVATGQELRQFTGHIGWVEACAFSPDGRTLATGLSSRTVHLWDVATGAEVRSFTGYTEQVTACAFSPDGRILAIGAGYDAARLWDGVTGQELRLSTGHSAWVYACAFSPDGRTLATAASDNTARLWDVVTGTDLRSFIGHSGTVSDCAFSPDGRTLVTASHDYTARLWDVSTGQELRQFTGHTEQVEACAFSPDGRTLATAAGDNTARLWDVATGQELRQFTGHTEWLFACAFSPDGRTLATGSSDDTVRLWDVATRQELHSSTGQADAVRTCAFSPDGRTLVTGADDLTVRLWDVATGEELRRFTWRTSARPGYTSAVTACYSPDGRTLAAAANDHAARLWDVSTGQELRQFTGHTEWVEACAFSPDGRTLATASYDGTARLWDVSTGQGLHQLTGHSRPVYGCAFSPDGRTLATASADDTTRLWDVATGTELCQFTGHTSIVWACVFSPDGRTLATASEDLTARLWDVATGEELRRFTGHTAWVEACAFSPDGRTLATASEDLTVRLWDVATGRELARCEVDAPLRSCSWSRKEPLIAAGDVRGAVHSLQVSGR